MKTNATIDQLNEALKRVNELFEDNIRFKGIQNEGRKVRFTLTVRDSKKAGHRRGFNGQRLAAACWHVHGNFFEALFSVNPLAIVETGGNKKITNDSGNCQDWNIGSIANPLYFSEACDCN